MQYKKNMQQRDIATVALWEGTHKCNSIGVQLRRGHHNAAIAAATHPGGFRSAAARRSLFGGRAPGALSWRWHAGSRRLSPGLEREGIEVDS